METVFNWLELTLSHRDLRAKIREIKHTDRNAYKEKNKWQKGTRQNLTMVNNITNNIFKLIYINWLVLDFNVLLN